MKIGVVSLAAALQPELIEKGAERLRGLGHEVHVHPNNFKQHLIYAGTPTERADTFKEYMRDTSFDVVLATRGIGGTLQVLDQLVAGDYPAAAPCFAGYSDNTVALIALMVHKGLRCVHGPMLIDIAGSATDDEIAQMLACAVNSENYDIEKLINADTYVVRPGQAQGRLIGGNLAAATSLMGTPYDWPTDGAILFFEDINEFMFRIDRTMEQYRLSGKIDKLNGVVIGDFTNAQPKGGNHEFEIDVWQYFADFFSDVSFPVIARAGFGHTGPKYSLLMGDEVVLSAPADGGRPSIKRAAPKHTF